MKASAGSLRRSLVLRRWALMLFVAAMSGCNGSGCNGDDSRGNAVDESQPANAQDQGGSLVPSCYAAVELDVPPPPPTRAVFVLIDQTTGIDDRLKDTARTNLERLLRPGSTFTVATFSAFTAGNFTRILASGVIEAPLSEAQRLHLSSPKVADMAACLPRQLAFARRIALEKFEEATGAATSSFTNSEIMASLRQLSEAVRASAAEERIVIVVSDLLEHSTVTSFYRDHNVRVIQPAEEMRKAEENGLIGDFDEARVAVIGAGLLAPDSHAAATRPSGQREALRRFWEQWFARSNAQLIAYGEPDLVAPIQ